MSSYITNITLLILSIIIYKQLRSYLSHRAFLAYAKRNGCEKPPTLPNKLPYGIERYKPMFTGIKGQSISQYSLPSPPSPNLSTSHT
jgi:hypothetical protein